MSEPLIDLIWSVILYGLPLFFGRRCLGVAFFLWPAGAYFLWSALWGALLAVSA